MRRIFTGRITRLAYFMASVYTTAGLVLLAILAIVAEYAHNGIVSDVMALLLLGFYLFSILVTIGTSIRRIHDMGETGWLTLLLLVPLINFIYVVMLYSVPSSKDGDIYGPAYSRRLNMKAVFGFGTYVSE